MLVPAVKNELAAYENGKDQDKEDTGLVRDAEADNFPSFIKN